MRVRLNAHPRALLPTESVFPSNRHAWDARVGPEWRYSAASVTNAGQSADGVDARRVSADASDGYFIASCPLDASTATHIDVDIDVLDADPVSTISALTVELGDTSGLTARLTFVLTTLVRYPSVSGRRTIRVPLSSASTTGTPDLAALTHVRVVLTAQASQTSDVLVYGVRLVERTRGTIHICFDDALVSQYANAFPIMQAYGLTGTVGVITDYVGGAVTSLPYAATCMTWAQLHEMEDAGFAIASHTHTHPVLAGKTTEFLQDQLGSAHDALVAQGFHLGAKGLICPFGSWDNTVASVARDYHLWVRSEGSGIQVFPTRHPSYGGHRSPLITDTVASLTDDVDTVIAGGGLMVFAFHEVLASGSGDYDYETTTADFEAFCAYVRGKVDDGVLDCLNWYELMGFRNRSAPLVCSTPGGPALALLP